MAEAKAPKGRKGRRKVWTPRETENYTDFATKLRYFAEHARMARVLEVELGLEVNSIDIAVSFRGTKPPKLSASFIAAHKAWLAKEERERPEWDRPSKGWETLWHR